MFAGSKNLVVAGGTFVMHGQFHSHTHVDASGERGGTCSSLLILS